MGAERPLGGGYAPKGYLDAFGGAKLQLGYIPDEGGESDCGDFSPDLTHLTLLSEEQIRAIRQMQEQDSEHGDTHVGRVGAWYRKFVFESDLEQQMPHFAEYTRAAEDALAIHDLVQVGAKRKHLHAQRAAMYSLTADTALEKYFDAYMAGRDTAMTREEWKKYKWVKAFIILNHHPEHIPSVDHILKHGLIDVKALHRKVGDFSNEFEMYDRYKHVVEELLIEEPPEFTREEIEAIVMQAYLVAAADKMDQYMPVRLSSNRTFQLNPGRAFYNPTRHKRSLRVEDEFKERVKEGEQSESPDDLSRLLFEMRRTDAFKNAPEVVQSIYAGALREKTAFLFDAIQEFLNGNFRPFVAEYDNLELAVMDNMLLGLGFPQKSRHSVFWDEKGNRRPNSCQRVRYFLDIYGFDPDLLDKTLESIRGQRSVVLGILQGKYDQLIQEQWLTPRNKRRIIELLTMARDTMERNLMGKGDDHVDLPYSVSGLFPIPWSRYKKIQMYH
jgi:hypothetical protein